MSRWHAMDIDEVLGGLCTDPVNGLDEEEAARRLEELGPNELEERGVKSPWRILWEQLTASMVVILIVAAVLSAFLGDEKDATAIVVIVILNALIGFRQEYKAEKAVAALRKLAVPNVKVQRSGYVQEVPALALVVGDIVLLEEGNLVPADCRLLEAASLKAQEAALTGESVPVEKAAGVLLEEGAPVADRRNMTYMGTVLTYGRGRAVVTETGMETELGRIASMIHTVESEATPLQRRMSKLGRVLAAAAMILVGVVVGLGVLRGEDIRTLFLTAISLAVAAIPEGLPAVVTVALALGSQRMLKRRALIRKLPAVEALGSVTVICSDKTGTLTENRMAVTVLVVAGCQLELTADRGRSGSKPDVPHLGESTLRYLEGQPLAVSLLLVGGALCSDASIRVSDNDIGELQVVGDPTEAALVTAAARVGLLKFELERALPRVAEIPFDSERKRMSTVHGFQSGRLQVATVPELLHEWASETVSSPYIAFTKGAVDSLIDLSRAVLADRKEEPLTDHRRESILAANNQLAEKGMRVLGIAYRQLQTPAASEDEGSIERDLVFVGMMGMIDPARPEVREAVAVCKRAGIRPVMITGDHPLTAGHIAQELGISAGGRVVTGQDMTRRSAEELEGTVEQFSVYARVSPEHKLSLVQALQNRGHIVAMTGDGVNDAPALKKADIGVAMGVTGTDVAKEVADMVLLDDNFTTIVAAVEEGRVIYDNIRKFVKYLLASNSGEIWVMLLAPLWGMPLPLLPLQILWINLVTDGLPALALSAEPAEHDLMSRPPRRPTESVFSGGAGWYIIWAGVIMGLVPLAAGHWYWRTGNPAWQTMVFMILTFAQMANVLAIRSERYSIFSIGLFSNKPLLAAILLTIALQVAVIYIPFFQQFLHTVPLSLRDLGCCIGLSSVIFWAVEIEKWARRR